MSHSWKTSQNKSMTCTCGNLLPSKRSGAFTPGSAPKGSPCEPPNLGASLSLQLPALVLQVQETQNLPLA